LLFSAAAQLASLRHARRPTSSGSLKEQTPMAKSSMVARPFPKTLLDHKIEKNKFFNNPLDKLEKVGIFL
jgi:hypothetical protein